LLFSLSLFLDRGLYDPQSMSTLTSAPLGAVPMWALWESVAVF
jgi:hypothetical protein